MTEQDRKDALDWLDEQEKWTFRSQGHPTVIKAMFAEPHLPKEPSEELVLAIYDFQPSGCHYSLSAIRVILAALYAHLSAPQKPAAQPLTREALSRVRANADRTSEPGPMMPPRLRWRDRYVPRKYGVPVEVTTKVLQYWYNDEWHDVPEESK